jgi:hypothetical protein
MIIGVYKNISCYQWSAYIVVQIKITIKLPSVAHYGGGSQLWRRPEVHAGERWSPEWEALLPSAA